MEWTMARDILLCREMLAINPFKAKGKTIQRTKIWETVVQHLEEIEEPPLQNYSESCARQILPFIQKVQKANG